MIDAFMDPRRTRQTRDTHEVRNIHIARLARESFGIIQERSSLRALPARCECEVREQLECRLSARGRHKIAYRAYRS